MSKSPKSKNITVPKKVAREIKVTFEEKFIDEGPSIVLKKQAVSFPIRSRIRMIMAWSTERKDIVGRWTWGPRKWEKRDWKIDIRPFLLDCEKKKWHELEDEKAEGGKKHKSYYISQICSEAQNRLIEINLDDLEQVFRFRLSNKQRLYGFLIQHVFYVLWWDPDHKIYPSNIQNRGKIRLGP